MEAVLTIWPGSPPSSYAIEKCTQTVDHAFDVHIQYPVPSIQPQVLDGRAERAHHARVVAEHVTAFEALIGGICHGLHSVCVADVGQRREHLDAELPRLVLDPLESLPVNVRKHQMGALGGKLQAHRAAHAVPCARHDCHRILQVLHRHRPFRNRASAYVKLFAKH